MQNTYFLPLTHYIPRDLEERENREIGQLAESLFCLPHLPVLLRRNHKECLFYELLSSDDEFPLLPVCVFELYGI